VLAAATLSTCALVASQAIWIAQARASEACAAQLQAAQQTAGDRAAAHIKYAHIQTPPAQQVQDATHADDYAKAHTIWVDSMASPTVDALTGPDC
jgi:hypothetical protein